MTATGVCVLSHRVFRQGNVCRGSIDIGAYFTPPNIGFSYTCNDRHGLPTRSRDHPEDT